MYCGCYLQNAESGGRNRENLKQGKGNHDISDARDGQRKIADTIVQHTRFAQRHEW